MERHASRRQNGVHQQTSSEGEIIITTTEQIQLAPLTQSYLHSILSYDPATGYFTWRYKVSRKIVAGQKAGSKHCQGYIQIRIQDKMYLSHRIAYLYMTGGFPALEIDHINGIRNDNRWRNLRMVDRTGNSRNMARSKRNTSGHTGLSWDKARLKWHVMIGKRNLGRFATKSEAIAARKAAEIEHNYHPNHGRPNA